MPETRLIKAIVVNQQYEMARKSLHMGMLSVVGVRGRVNTRECLGELNIKNNMKCYDEKVNKWCGKEVTEDSASFPFFSEECRSRYWGKEIENRRKSNLSVEEMQAKLREFAAEERQKKQFDKKGGKLFDE